LGKLKIANWTTLVYIFCMKLYHLFSALTALSLQSIFSFFIWSMRDFASSIRLPRKFEDKFDFQHTVALQP